MQSSLYIVSTTQHWDIEECQIFSDLFKTEKDAEEHFTNIMKDMNGDVTESEIEDALDHCFYEHNNHYVQIRLAQVN